MPGLGHKSELRFGKETTFGGGATPTHKLEIVRANFPPDVGVLQDQALYNGVSRRGLYQGGFLVRGTFVVRMNYDGMLELFRGIWGSGVSAVVGGETIVRDHTMKEASTLPSYEIQAGTGAVPTGRSCRLQGAKFVNAKIAGTAGQGVDAMLQAEVTVLAKDMTSDFTPTGSAAFPAILPVLYHQASGATGVVDDGTADSGVRVRQFEVTLEQPHTEDRFYMGSVNIDEPLRSDFLTARWRLVQEFQTKTQYDAARAFTVGSPRLVFAHPTTIGTGSKREFELRSNQANIVEWGAPVEGFGVILSTVQFEAFQDPTDVTALLARFRNLEAAIV